MGERENSVTGRTTMTDTSRASVTPSVFDRHQTAERTVAAQDETLSRQGQLSFREQPCSGAIDYYRSAGQRRGAGFGRVRVADRRRISNPQGSEVKRFFHFFPIANYPFVSLKKGIYE